MAFAIRHPVINDEVGKPVVMPVRSQKVVNGEERSYSM